MLNGYLFGIPQASSGKATALPRPVVAFRQEPAIPLDPLSTESPVTSVVLIERKDSLTLHPCIWYAT
jgi:hypothetical protein